MTEKKTPAYSLEKSLGELESIIRDMENAEQPLDASLKSFEQGVRLIKEAKAYLQKAEQHVQILVKDNLEDFPHDSDHEHN